MPFLYARILSERRYFANLWTICQAAQRGLGAPSVQCEKDNFSRSDAEAQRISGENLRYCPANSLMSKSQGQRGLYTTVLTPCTKNQHFTGKVPIAVAPYRKPTLGLLYLIGTYRIGAKIGGGRNARFVRQSMADKSRATESSRWSGCQAHCLADSRFAVVPAFLARCSRGKFAAVYHSARSHRSADANQSRI